MASSSSSRTYHTNSESAKRGSNRDSTSRARTRDRAGKKSAYTTEKRTIERTHITDTTLRGVRVKSPSREDKSSKSTGFPSGSGGSGSWGAPSGNRFPFFSFFLSRFSGIFFGSSGDQGAYHDFLENYSASWNPEATLIPPTTAPLASRISIAPLASQLPPSWRVPSLEGMTLELQEASILEDLLFVFMVG